MDTVKELQSEIDEYAKWTSIVKEDPYSPDFLAPLNALFSRDVLFDRWNDLTVGQKLQVETIDKEFISIKEFVANILPDKSSTPQARAEGRWWWFLNEN